ncbi:MAG TPA: SDR family oxidoreductase [Acidimicrobiia bacterium]|jgi:NAD(P)-dependent dehydrogenase (short-subunit alcohol dehydrogenase family)
MRLAGELALVTGSTSGIGRAIATRFAAEGARVAVHGRNRERGEAVVAAILERGGDATFLAADLAGEAESTGLVDAAAAALGGLTVLVNNAVAAIVDETDGPVAELTTSAWEASLRVNLTAPMWLCRRAIPHMIDAGHGAIVNISSRQAERSSPRLTAYAASKSGLNGLTRAIAVDYAKVGIRCNTISPGYVVNERRDASIDPETRRRREAQHLTRLGVADDVAHAAVYLAGHESDFVTGINLALDGGSSAARGLVLG